MKTTISAIIIAHNESERIADVIRSAAFCDEVVLVDSFSTDGTTDIAASLGAKVFRREYRGTNDQKEFARSVSTGDWVFEIDGDEVAGPELGEQAIEAVNSGRHAAYSFPFRTIIGGRTVRFGMHLRERHVRLFRRSCYYDTSREPHNRLVVDGTVGRLSGVIVHSAMDSLGERVEKSARYARLAGEAMAARGKTPHFLNPVFNPAWRFFKEFVLNLGFLDGSLGFRLAVLSAREVRLKYVIARELAGRGAARV